jgi:hypothetical protein
MTFHLKWYYKLKNAENYCFSCLSDISLSVWPYSNNVRAQELEDGSMEGDCSLELKLKCAGDMNGLVPPISVKIFQKQSYTRLQNVVIDLNLFRK